jgi:hypothetical protein
MPGWVTSAWTPALLALAALLATLVAMSTADPAAVSGGLLALALLLCAAAALLAGALWSRQRQSDRLRDARQQAQLLGQLVDVWCWQTDADHRLVRLQPPQGAPASSWVAGAFQGDCLWQRFDDADHSLQPRMQAQGALGELQVLQAPATAGAAPRRWRLRGLPRLDGRGRFAGYTGVAWPTDGDDQAAAARQAEADVRGAAAVADAKAQSSAARLAELRESIERGDGLDGALVRLRDRGVSLVTDQLRPDQGIERAVAAALQKIL